jgi:hypothetical protein
LSLLHSHLLKFLSITGSRLSYKISLTMSDMM